MGILRYCAWGGLDLPVPPELLDDKRFQKPIDRINASYVRLTASDLTESDAEGCAETIAKASGDNFDDQSEQVLSMLASREAVGPAVERVTLSILAKVSSENLGARQTAYRLLRGWLAKRRSRLGEVEKQRALGLEFLANLRGSS